jgi:hypothetical protein
LFNAPAAFCDGNNIFGANLIFADTAGGDFHLLPCSDGVNAGDLSAIVDGEILTDLNGLPRIAHGLPDVGAFETVQEATPLPQISASIFPASSAFATDGAIVVELLNGDSDDYSFLWNTGTTGFVIENIAAGIYTVTITDTTGCYVIHSFELGTVGTSEPGTGAISVFPNPVQAGSMLHFSQPFSGILKIKDISGRELSGLVSIGAQYIKIPEVPSGAYIATFQAESGQITALRLFIQ